MANPVKGEILLVVGSDEQDNKREYKLVIDFEARVLAEEACNRPFAEIGARAARGFHADVRAIFWSALQRHHSEITLQQAGEMLEEDGDVILAAMTAAGEAAAAPDKGGNGPNRRERRASKSSGGSGAKQA